MDNSNEMKKNRVLELKSEIARDELDEISQNGENLIDLDYAMLKLLHVDTMIQSMRFFVKNEATPRNKESDKALNNFIISYKNSHNQIYDNDNLENFDNILQNIRDNIKISKDLSSYENFMSIPDNIPSTSEEIDAIRQYSLNIVNCEKEIDNLKSVSKGNTPKTNGEVDKEAMEVLNKITERAKKKDKSAKILQFAYGKDEIVMTTLIKKNRVSALLRNSLFEPLNTPEGIERLNNAIANESQEKGVKASNKIDNENTKNDIKALEEQIAINKQKVSNLQLQIGKKVEEHFKNLPNDKLLEAFMTKPNGLHDIMTNCCNFDRLQKNLSNSFKNEKKIWDYIKDAEYYEMIKYVVKKGAYHDRDNPVSSKYKDTIIYQAMSKPLKKLIDIREIELYGLKKPDENSIEEMNELLEKHGYRIRLQKISISNQEKPEEFSGKANFEIARTILANTIKAPDEKSLSAYARNNMQTGLMYCIGEGIDKNDESQLFKIYMQIYFDKKDFSTLDSIKLRKEYAWEEYRNENMEIAKSIYQEISKNSNDPEALKENLCKGGWSKDDDHSTHHNFPRKLSFALDDPEKANNNPNLTKTITWNAWEEDPHRMEHFFSMSQNDGIDPYLTKKGGEYTRVKKTDYINEVYYEKPQVYKDGKWEDLIPNNTLLITPNMTIKSPKLPNRVRHLALECFDNIPDIDIETNIQEKTFDIFEKKRKEKEISM